MLKTRVYESIQEIEPALLDALLPGHSVTFSHAFWRILEASGLNDFRYRYLIIFDESEQPVCLAAFYVVTTDIAIFAPPWLRRGLIWARRFFPGLLKLKMLECGSPIILNSPPVILHPGVTPETVMGPLHDALTRHARAEGALLVVLRDFEASAQAWLTGLGRYGYHAVTGLPNTYLDIRWGDVSAYRVSLQSYYRSKINNHLRKNAKLKVRHDVVDDFAGFADTLCQQWLVVHGRADEFQREILTPAFYRELALGMGQRAKVLRFFRDDLWIGHALVLQDGDMLRWLYFGRTEAVNDSLYLYVIQAVIETAINLGAKRIEMGLTTYPIKQDAGAYLEPIQFAIRCPIGVFNPLVGRLYALLNKPTTLQNKSVFKQDVSAK